MSRRCCRGRFPSSAGSVATRGIRRLAGGTPSGGAVSRRRTRASVKQTVLGASSDVHLIVCGGRHRAQSSPRLPVVGGLLRLTKPAAGSGQTRLRCDDSLGLILHDFAQLPQSRRQC